MERSDLKREKRIPLPLRVKSSLKSDIEAVATKEKVTATEVAEAWLLVGQKAYRERK